MDIGHRLFFYPNLYLGESSLNLLSKAMKEAISSVLPIFAIVLVLSVSIAPLETGVLVLFL